MHTVMVFSSEVGKEIQMITLGEKDKIRIQLDSGKCFDIIIKEGNTLGIETTDYDQLKVVIQENKSMDYIEIVAPED